MKTTNKKLQLKKETMAVLNDKSLFAINGGNNPNEEDGDGIETLNKSQCYPTECGISGDLITKLPPCTLGNMTKQPSRCFQCTVMTCG